ncbi:MAG TPA: hypothetical protein VLD67_16495 [Vicinamibacterales bacterium]|nr:hypothetical protein [Vicinamibacterales bacterium]
MTALKQLPAQVAELGLQITQFREEFRAEFSAIRGVGGEGLTLAGLRDEIRAIRGEGGEGLSLAALRDEIRAVRGEGGEGLSLASLRDEIRAIRGEGGDGLSLVILRDEIRAGDEDTRSLMRVLHEDLVQRIALLHEVRPTTRRRRKRGKQPPDEPDNTS